MVLGPVATVLLLVADGAAGIGATALLACVDAATFMLWLCFFGHMKVGETALYVGAFVRGGRAPLPGGHETWPAARRPPAPPCCPCFPAARSCFSNRFYAQQTGSPAMFSEEAAGDGRKRDRVPLHEPHGVRPRPVRAAVRPGHQHGGVQRHRRAVHGALHRGALLPGAGRAAGAGVPFAQACPQAVFGLPVHTAAVRPGVRRPPVLRRPHVRRRQHLHHAGLPHLRDHVAQRLLQRRQGGRAVARAHVRHRPAGHHGRHACGVAPGIRLVAPAARHAARTLRRGPRRGGARGGLHARVHRKGGVRGARRGRRADSGGERSPARTGRQKATPRTWSRSGSAGACRSARWRCSTCC